MRETLLFCVPHRQVVFVISRMLRIFFRYKRWLLEDLCQAAVSALLKYLQATTGAELPGIVASIQTLGEKTNFYAHLHLLVTEGGEDSEGRFHHLAEFQDSFLAKFFSHEVFSLLFRRKLISEAVVEKIMGWRHSGFSVHSKVMAQTRQGLSGWENTLFDRSYSWNASPSMKGKGRSAAGMGKSRKRWSTWII